MSENYNEQVESFTISDARSLKDTEVVKNSLFKAMWTSFGDTFNLELALRLSYLTPQVSLDSTSVSFNVFQTVDRADLQLLRLLQTTRGPKELIIYTFDRTGKRLPLYTVLTVGDLYEFNLNHDWDETWENPVTSFKLGASVQVRSI